MVENHYTGWTSWEPSISEWADLTTQGIADISLKENEYLIVRDSEEGDTKSNYEIYKKVSDRLIKVPRGSIKLNAQKNQVKSKKKKTDLEFDEEKIPTALHPRNAEQVCAFDLVKDSNTTVKLITGTWGCGKTLILVAAALDALYNNQFEKIIWIRNNVDVKDTKDLGALPGDVNEKLLPFLGPFVDHAGKNEVIRMINEESLVIEPLQSLRGRNFKNSLIICSEAENLTKEHLQLIIARAAEGSQVWLDGDTRQRDKAAFEKSRGLETLIDRLQGNPLFGYVHLIKSERSATAALADLLDK